MTTTASAASNISGHLKVMEDMGAAFNHQDLDGIMACFANNAVYQDTTGAEPTGHVVAGKAAIRDHFAAMFANLPRFYFENFLPVAMGERAALEYTVVLAGEPQRRMQLCDFFEFENGLVVRKSTWAKQLPTQSAQQ